MNDSLNDEVGKPCDENPRTQEGMKAMQRIKNRKQEILNNIFLLN
jgi:hypothetical protein